MLLQYFAWFVYYIGKLITHIGKKVVLNYMENEGLKYLLWESKQSFVLHSLKVNFVNEALKLGMAHGLYVDIPPSP